MARPRAHAIARLAAMPAVLALALCVTVPAVAATAESPPATVLHPMRDPWVPPELRQPSSAPPTHGAALRAQVERKLKAGFDAADVGHGGTLTREQARAAGLGYIVGHFDEIDRRRAGAVSFDDVKSYLRERGAQLN
ncbi:MAG: EF-hand domain-containing protein [Casimicrobiaceae bacterium]